MSTKYYDPERAKQVRADRRARGVCTTCGKREAAIGFVQCPECIERGANYAAKYRNRDRDAWNAKARAWNKKRVAEGRCKCGRDAAPEHTLCERCLLKRRQYNRRRYVRKIKPPGVCKWCDEPAVEGKKLCAAHLEKMRAVAMNMQKYIRDDYFKRSNTIKRGR